MALCVAGPPCKPRPKGGKGPGAKDERAGLCDETIWAIQGNRTRACLLEDRDRIPTYMGGRW